jgi:glycosyltransferase involved in cell wall biosynthesis
MTAPSLSVIVVVGPLRERAGPCLRSLLDQELAGGLEILLLDRATAAFAALPVPHAEDGRVRYLRLDETVTFAEARAIGVRQAGAPMVAFLEEHCRAQPGWAAALLEAFGEGWCGVGYGFLNANPGVGLSDFTGLTSYTAFQLPTERRVSRMLSGHNAAYRRDILMGLGERLEELLTCDLVLHEVLCRRGHRLLIEPRAVVAHLNETTIRSRARGLYHFNRVYAPLRAREFAWSRSRRIGYVLAAPLVPPYAFYNHWRQVRTPANRRLLLRSLWAHVFVTVAAAAGQTAGLLFGAGDSALRFSDFETGEPRPQA